MTQSRILFPTFNIGCIIALVAMVIATAVPLHASGHLPDITIESDADGTALRVDGRDFMIIGMNWDYFPRGTTYTYSLWLQPDDIIKSALDAEMSLLRSMGVNAVRLYTGVTPRWVEYIYKEYGIFTVLNHSFGRYGVTLDGAYIANTDYADSRTRDVLLAEVKAVAEEFKDVPGVLMYLLGNENNYGLFWGGAETEDIPEGETLESVRARHMYSLFNEGIKAITAKDSKRPVAICNGDLLFIDIIAEEITEPYVFGTNMYRGVSFGDAFQVVKDKLGVPLMFTEFGADAYNAQEMREDQFAQARYAIENWKEIYEQSSGKGLVGNSIGGLHFQFSDGWWKFGQETDLDVHDTNASWSNGGYTEDYKEGENNMNEEWFGICAKGPTNQRGLYELFPRAAFYALKEAFKLDPYASSTDLSAIRDHFSALEPMEFILKARGDQAALLAQSSQKIRLKGMQMRFETYSTGGTRVSTPDEPEAGSTVQPAFRGFDHMESYFAEIEAQPIQSVRGTLSLNFLGHIPNNPIDEIFYENRGRQKTVLTDGEPVELNDIERLKVYNASLTWDSRWFNLEGFYRTGHYHWGYEGDFFGLYPEAHYGPNIDIYNGEAPLGFEVTGKKSFGGLKMAFGPELWWGANPAVLLKYRRNIGPFTATGIYQEDLDEQGATVSSIAVPVPPTRKATIHLSTERGPMGLEVGGIWSGNNKIDDEFQLADGSPGDYRILTDRIKSSDTFGGKVKLTYSKGRWNWYAQASARGLVADGGPTSAITYTGWWLKDNGIGNQWNALTGIAVTLGNWQIAPNFLWQKPIEAPIPGDVPAPGRPRNVLDDPFAVRANRETIAGELLINYDPTPATWMFAWDSDIREDAKLAASVGFIFRRHETTQDAAIGILSDGRTTFAFPGAPPARDLWEAHGRFVSKLRPGLGMVANLFAGEGEPNGDDDRLIERYGGDVRFVWDHMKVTTSAKINDWGPYDYHRDFNLTYPVQLMGDISYNLEFPQWFDVPQTRLGIRATWRSLDEYSPRYCPAEVYNVSGELECDPEAPGDDGNEWEIRTYLHFVL